MKQYRATEIVDSGILDSDVNEYNICDCEWVETRGRLEWSGDNECWQAREIEIGDIYILYTKYEGLDITIDEDIEDRCVREELIEKLDIYNDNIDDNPAHSDQKKAEKLQDYIEEVYGSDVVCAIYYPRNFRNEYAVTIHTTRPEEITGEEISLEEACEKICRSSDNTTHYYTSSRIIEDNGVEIRIG